MRLHLFELEDYPWYPEWLRASQTDYLRTLMETFNVFKAASPILSHLMQQQKCTHLQDLCSGGGGALLLIYKDYYRITHQHFTATLSDLYPNIAAFKNLAHITNNHFQYQAQSFNALAANPSPKSIRTIFNAFHHFKPADAQQLLQNAADQNMPIAIFEPMDKSILQLLVNILSTSILMFFLMPFVRPFTWKNFVFTYLFPLLPLATCWDGIASWFRLYDAATLEKMAAKVDAPNYIWKSGVASHQFGKITYLIGYKSLPI